MHKISFTSFSLRLSKQFVTKYFKKETNIKETLKQSCSFEAIKITFWEYNCIYMY